MLKINNFQDSIILNNLPSPLKSFDEIKDISTDMEENGSNDSFFLASNNKATTSNNIKISQ